MESPKKNKPQKARPSLPPRKKLLNPNSGELIAITGGIGTGKTFVLECFAKLGFAVFNADKVVHDLLQKNGEAFAAVSKLFPNAVTDEGLDRTIIGEIVYKDPAKLKELESIIHPLVRSKQVEFSLKLKSGNKKSAVFEVPLLFENKREGQFDYVIVTTAPEEIRKSRVLARKGMTEEKFTAILSKQISDGVRLKKADFIIKTGKTPEDTFRQVTGLIYDANVKRNSARHRNDRPLSKQRRPSSRDRMRGNSKPG